MNKPEKIYFENLDALRSIACLFVLVSHIVWEILTRNLNDSGLVNNPVSFFFFGNGGLGVRIFFTLSGFLITFLIIKEIQKNGKLNLKNFYLRRVLRIWPVYFIVVFFVFVVYALIKKVIGNESVIHENPVMSILFLSNYDLIRILDTPSIYPNGMLSLTWSVSVEEQFYLFWPLLFVLIPLRFFKWVVLAVISIAIAFSLMHADNKEVIYHHTLSNFLFLGAGGLLAYLLIRKPTFTKWVSQFSKSSWLAFFIAGLAFMIFLREPLFKIKMGIVVYFIGTAIVLFFLLLNQIADVKRPFELGASSILVTMGKYTYGLYMYHRIAMFIWETLLYKIIKVQTGITADVIFVVLSILTVFVFSYISYEFIEKRLLQFKDRFSYFKKEESLVVKPATSQMIQY